MSDLLRDAFERIAARAQPVPGLAEDALRRTSRKRTLRLSSAVAIAVAATMAVPFLLSGGWEPKAPEPATQPSGLPSNTPDEQALVRSCLSNSPQIPSDYRLLVDLGRAGGSLAVVGGNKGFVLCSRGPDGNIASPALRWWLKLDEKGLWSFNGEARIDAIVSMPKAKTGGGASTTRSHHVIAGRLKPGVLKVMVTWNRNRTSVATIHNGFFIAAIETSNPEEPRVLKVDAYGDQGLPLYSWSAGQTGGSNDFNSATCDKPQPVPTESLCQGLPDRP